MDNQMKKRFKYMKEWKSSQVFLIFLIVVYKAGNISLINSLKFVQ